MNSIIEVDRLHSVSVVVDDLHSATLRYAEIFGVDHWEIRVLGPDRLSDNHSRGHITHPSLRTATGVTTPPAEGGIRLTPREELPVRFELVQPTGGQSPFAEFRSTHGQGIASITIAVRTRDEFATLRAELAREGIGVAASMTVDGRLQRHFLDSRSALGGFLVEVQVPLDSGAEDNLAVTDQWNHRGRYSRPSDVGPLAVQGVSHFGVVVDDLLDTLPHYHRWFGIEQWNIQDWRTEPGRLENPYYRRQPVEHAYFTGLSTVADFGFEIIQPTTGPSHYNREFRDLSGPGIHHMLVNVTTDRESWDRTRDWLDSIGVPLAMGADLKNGAAHFCYYDTTDALGYLTEAVLIQKTSAPPPVPDYIVDFAAVFTGGTR